MLHMIRSYVAIFIVNLAVCIELKMESLCWFFNIVSVFLYSTYLFPSSHIRGTCPLSHDVASGIDLMPCTEINKPLLSCQPRVTVKSCSVYKVIRDLELIDHPQDRINTQVIYRFALAQAECSS